MKLDFLAEEVNVMGDGDGSIRDGLAILSCCDGSVYLNEFSFRWIDREWNGRHP